MQTAVVTRRFATLEKKEGLADYNYTHFRTKHYLPDARRTLTDAGIQPGELAPDFELPRVDGASLRLSDLHDKPVLLHFGSIT